MEEGDHGPHFASKQSMYYESSCYRRYGKEVELNFYVSYHACGRADGAGAEDKRDSADDFRNAIPRLGAKSYTDMTNESPDQLSIAYEFPAINRSEDVFRPDKELKAPK